VSLVIFYILGAAILIAALMVVTLRNVFHSALFLVATFFFVAGIYLMLNAEFLAAVQVLIYVGAVTILILFAITLTHKIHSKSIRQVNEQVLPAFIITGLFLAIAIITIMKTFGHHSPGSDNFGSWTASFDTDTIRSETGPYEWSARLVDSNGEDYNAFGNFILLEDNEKPGADLKPKRVENSGSGYILSSNSGFTSSNNEFNAGQKIYFKIWSDGVDYRSIASAQWHIFKIPDSENGDEPWKLLGSFPKDQIITLELVNSNPESIGRLLMSKFVLPFEVVSVLLLAAMIGAIVIARKDD
jgi:NADH:ubiquinone oxidoreductase subunit 6 (subunit J)